MSSTNRQRPTWLPEVDLRSATRASAYVETTVDVVLQGERYRWLTFGALSRVDVEPGKHQWMAAYFPNGITDESEDSAYALHLELVGITLVDLSQGATTLEAWIAGSAEDGERFKVPSKPYDLSSFKWCPTCEGKEKHQMTSYTPAPNLELWKKLRGVKILICTRPIMPEDE